MKNKEEFYYKYSFLTNKFNYKGEEVGFIKLGFFPKFEYKILLKKNEYKASVVSDYWTKSGVYNKQGKIVVEFEVTKNKLLEPLEYFFRVGNRKYTASPRLLGEVNVYKKGSQDSCLSFSYMAKETDFNSKELSLEEAIFMRILIERYAQRSNGGI